QVILEQFSPSLKNFMCMRKQYEKVPHQRHAQSRLITLTSPLSPTGVTAIAKDYFDTLGELASDSQGLKELGKRGRVRGARAEDRGRDGAGQHNNISLYLYTPSLVEVWSSLPRPVAGVDILDS
ncbi:BAIP2 protein, partial [Atractosteus spatula]|nr:BAIP2 protein [Atractosteus spatula]